MTLPTPGTASFWWLGHASFVLEGPTGGPIAVDPYLSDSFEKAGGSKRESRPPVQPADLRVSTIILTHDHLDHTDPDTLPALCAANPDAPIFGPPSSIAHLARLGIKGNRTRTLQPGEIIYGEGWRVHGVHAEHTEDSVGLVFVFDQGPHVYHLSDTKYFDGLLKARESEITLLTLHIDEHWGDLTIRDAVKITKALAPREVLPMHWGMFAETSADPRTFAAQLAASGSATRCVILDPTGKSRHLISAR